MKIVSFFKNTANSLAESTKRFPIPLVFSTMMFLTLICISERTLQRVFKFSDLTLQRFTMTLFIGFLLTLCIDLYFEQKDKWPLYIKATSYVLSILILILFYLYVIKDLSIVSASQYIGSIFVLLLGFFFIPSAKKDDNIENYSITVLTRLIITFVYSFVLFLGIDAIILTLDKLLNVPIKTTLYYYVWLFSILIFGPLFFLGGIPQKDETFKNNKYPYFLKVLFLYIIIPISMIYLGILYIYFAKIIITRTWPVGLVSHLVAWFSLICVISIFFTMPIKKNKFISFFHKYLPISIIPILIMMFISMGIRIKHYGITENRYYILVLGIWILMVMLYFIKSKHIKSKYLPLSLAIVITISIFGPLSSFNISRASQNHRLTKLLNKNNMLSNGSVVSNSDISEKDKKEINNILTYFNNYHSLSNVKVLPDDFSINNMENVFGFKYQGYDPYLDSYIYYNLETQPNILDISNFDYYIDYTADHSNIKLDKLNIKYDDEKGFVNIYIDENLIYSLNLSDYITSIYNTQHDSNISNDFRMLSIEDLTFNVSNEQVDLKFIFYSLRGNRQGDVVSFKDADFILLINVK